MTINTLSTTAPSPSPIFDIIPQATSIGFYENLNTPINQELQNLASEGDVAIIFTANNKEHESESFRSRFTVIVYIARGVDLSCSWRSTQIHLANQTGSPTSMLWTDEVDSILQCWYTGQEVGNAQADIISGDVDPSGKLPVTFPLCIVDTPSIGNFLTYKNMRIRYKEGLEMGYRARSKPAPLLPFGFGKSYTDFKLEGFAIKAALHRWLVCRGFASYSGCHEHRTRGRP